MTGVWVVRKVKSTLRRQKVPPALTSPRLPHQLSPAEPRSSLCPLTQSKLSFKSRAQQIFADWIEERGVRSMVQSLQLTILNSDFI